MRTPLLAIAATALLTACSGSPAPVASTAPATTATPNPLVCQEALVEGRPAPKDVWRDGCVGWDGKRHMGIVVTCTNGAELKVLDHWFVVEKPTENKPVQDGGVDSRLSPFTQLEDARTTCRGGR